MRLNILLKLANKFYSIAVPLDDGGLIDLRSVEEVGHKPLPDVKSYIAHFANTKLLYRIIYLPEDLENIRGGGLPVSIGFFKSFLEQEIGDDRNQGAINSRVESITKHLSDKAINIVANKFSQDDKMSPDAISHDLGHGLKIEDLINSMINDLIDPMIDDYDFFLLDKNNKIKNKINLTLSLPCGREIVSHLISDRFEIQESISRDNLKKQKVFDAIPDFLAEYHLQGDTLNKLQGVKILGKDLYLRGEPGYFEIEDNLEEEKYNLLECSENTIRTSPFKNKNKNKKDGSIYILARPKNINMPNLNEEIANLDIFNDMSQRIKHALNEYVGKVLLLW